MDKLPKITPETEIHEIVELDGCEGYSNCLGYFAFGVWDAQSFAIACNQEFSLMDMDRPVHTSAVVHGWHENVECDEGTQIIFRKYFREGLQAVTRVDYY